MLGIRRASRAAWESLRQGLLSLKGSPRDLYIVFVLKVLESYNYFATSRILTLYLTEEFGMSDVKAGSVYGLWGTLLTAYGFLMGGAVDYLGVKASLIVCFLLNITGRFVMAYTSDATLLLWALLGPNTMAGALGVPVMTIGIKRYTNDENRGFSFSLFYSLMNAAALVAGLSMDFFRITLRQGFDIPSLPPHSLLNNGTRLYLFSGCITSTLGLLISFMLSSSGGPPAPLLAKRAGSSDSEGSETDLMLGSRPGSQTAGGGRRASAEVELPSPEMTLLLRPGERGGSSASLDSAAEAATTGAGAARHTAFAGAADAAAPLERGQHEGAAERSSFLSDLRIILSSKGFWKFLTMCVLCINLKAVFRHLDALLSKYQLRAFGCDAPVGLIYSINPAFIIVLVPVVGAMTTQFQPFDMIHYGGYISALSCFWIVAFGSLWSTAAFVAMLSLGEAIWSPRWYDYSMAVAPHGKEGIFTSLASAPLFAAQLPVGMLSGALLQRYCPDNGQCEQSSLGGSSGSSSSSMGSLAVPSPEPVRRLLRRLLAQPVAGGPLAAPDPDPPAYPCDGRTMWGIIGLLTLSSPVMVLLMQRWIRPSPKDFSRLRRRPTLLEGDHAVETDPLAVLEDVSFAAATHEQEAATPPQPRSSSRGSAHTAGAHAS